MCVRIFNFSLRHSKRFRPLLLEISGEKWLSGEKRRTAGQQDGVTEAFKDLRARSTTSISYRTTFKPVAVLTGGAPHVTSAILRPRRYPEVNWLGRDETTGKKILLKPTCMQRALSRIVGGCRAWSFFIRNLGAAGGQQQRERSL